MASRAATFALRLAVGLAIWWLIADARGIVEDLGELGSRRWWLPLLPLAAAGFACRWAFGSVAWGVVAWVLAIAATVGSSRLQAWCLGGDSDLAGADDLGGSTGPMTVLWGYAALAVAAIAAAARGRGGEAHRVAPTVLMFGGALIAAMVAGLGLRGGAIDWALSLGALAAYPPLAVAAVAMAGLARGLARSAGRRPACGWSLVNTACGYGIFLSACALMPAFAAVALCAGRRRRRLVRAGMRFWMRLVFIGTPTVRWRWRGERDALERRSIVVANHESILDILMACALPGTRNLLAKTWVFRAPILGLAARAGGVLNVDRLDPDDFLGGGVDLLGHEGLFVFPEGHRSRNGVTRRFRLGAFALADCCGREVVPVAMAGGFWTATPGALWIHPGEVASVALPPLRRGEDEPVRAFAERARETVAQATLTERRRLAATPFAARNRRGWAVGLPPHMRAAALAEERSGAPLALIAAAGAPGDWWLIGCGWGPAALALRQIAPWSRLLACDPDPERLIAASYAWYRPGDELALEPGAAPEELAGLLCLLPFGDPAAGRARVEAARALTLVVPEAEAAAWGGALLGHERTETIGGLAILRSRLSSRPAPSAAP